MALFAGNESMKFLSERMLLQCRLIALLAMQKSNRVQHDSPAGDFARQHYITLAIVKSSWTSFSRYSTTHACLSKTSCKHWVVQISFCILTGNWRFHTYSNLCLKCHPVQGQSQSKEKAIWNQSLHSDCNNISE